MADLFFNDLSLMPCSPTIEDARRRMDGLVETIMTAVDAGATRRLRLAVSLDDALLAENYRFNDWRDDAEVDREYRRYWRSRLSEHYPVEHPEDAQEERDRFGLSDFSFGGSPSVALGAAALFGGLALSLESDPKWLVPILPINWRLLVDHESGEITDLLSARHAAVPVHIGSHGQWLRPPAQVPINLVEVWAQRANLFPHLEFCHHVEQQFDWAQHSNLFNMVLRRLQDLESVMADWAQGGAPDYARASGRPRPEGEATLKQYGEQRTFVCPDGQQRVFSWHLSLSKGDRIHFLADEDRRICIVGYVGPHLQTVRND